MDPKDFENIHEEGSETNCLVSGLFYAKSLLHHLLWITISAIDLILLTIIILQFLYDHIRLTYLFLILLIIFILVTILFQKKKKKIRWTDNMQVWTKVILRSKI